MKTLVSPVDRGRTYSLDLRSPLSQPGTVWATLSDAELAAAQKVIGLRRVDPGDILALTQEVLGPVRRWVVLGDNVIGATGWRDIPLARQYKAVTAGAAAFIASAMLYLRVRGAGADGVLDSLSPRQVSDLAVGGARFCLFTTPVGTVDEEAVVVRVARDEFLLSCGGGKPPGWLLSRAACAGNVTVTEADLFSFNIKGPRRLAATLTLLNPAAAAAVSALEPFQSCVVQTAADAPARVVRTVVGYEIWARAPILREVWRQVLDSPSVVLPAGWDLLNIYRVECPLMVFALYPLDLHAGTRLDEIGFDWMCRKTNDRDYLGRAVLEETPLLPRFWLAGLASTPGVREIPLIGRDVLRPDGGFTGHITTATESPRHGGPLAFAHLDIACRPDSTVLVDDQPWTVRELPFWRY